MEMTILLRKETERLNQSPVAYSGYDTSLAGYIVIPAKAGTTAEKMQEYGYQPVTSEEIRKNVRLQRYPKKQLFKIKIEELRKIHNH